MASFVTAYARIHMSQFKNNKDFIVYYSDTDSLFTNKPLSDNLINEKKLGYMKLEKVLTKFVGLGPKVYGGTQMNGETFVKVKGLKNIPTLNQIESLLIKDNQPLLLNQEKWLSNTKEGSITVNNTNYTLAPTETKRTLIYRNGKLIATKNLVITKNNNKD